MSHRALLAVGQDKPGRYNIHYSANGADELQLTEKLERNINNGELDLNSLVSEEAKYPKQAVKWAENASENFERGDIGQDTINRTPMYENLSKEQIGAIIEYDNIEALYIVNNGKIKTYVPVWMEPNIIRPIRRNLTIEVYKAGKFTEDIDKTIEELEEKQPQRVIDEKALSGSEWADDTIIWDVLLRNHESISALQRVRVEQNKELEGRGISEDMVKLAILQANGRTLFIKGEFDEDIFRPRGKGMLVQIPNHNTSRYSYVEKKANQERMKIGTRLNAPGRPPTEQDLTEEMKFLTKNLFGEFLQDVSPLSPDPFGEMAKRL